MAVNSHIDGNLALAIRDEPTSRFAVIDGGKSGSSNTERTECSVQEMKGVSSVTSPLSRMRLIVGIAALILVLGFVFGQNIAHAFTMNAALNDESHTSIEVVAGQSLWSVAESHPIQGLSTGDTVEVIRSWNNLSSGSLQPGQTLVVPDGVVS